MDKNKATLTTLLAAGALSSCIPIPTKKTVRVKHSQGHMLRYHRNWKGKIVEVQEWYEGWNEPHNIIRYNPHKSGEVRYTSLQPISIAEWKTEGDLRVFLESGLFHNEITIRVRNTDERETVQSKIQEIYRVRRNQDSFEIWEREDGRVMSKSHPHKKGSIYLWALEPEAIAGIMRRAAGKNKVLTLKEINSLTEETYQIREEKAIKEFLQKRKEDPKSVKWVEPNNGNNYWSSSQNHWREIKVDLPKVEISSVSSRVEQDLKPSKPKPLEVKVDTPKNAEQIHIAQPEKQEPNVETDYTGTGLMLGGAILLCAGAYSFWKTMKGR